MSAAAILLHQFASSIPFAYIGMAVLFWKRKPVATSKLNPPGRKPVHSIHLAQGCQVKLEPGQDPVSPFIDVDMKYCSDEELQHLMLRLVKSAKSLTLTDEEVAVFWDLHKELSDRQAKQVKRWCYDSPTQKPCRDNDG